jgi:hypothetical protein
MIGFIVICAVVILFTLLIISGKKSAKKSLELGYDYTQKIILGNYISGHPEIDKSCKKVNLIPKDGKLDLLYMPVSEQALVPVYLGSLSPELITNITVEDQSTFERRITLTRVALVGVFALLWKKKKKNELAYLTLFWNDGKFDHETLFEFEGINSIENANTSRNQLIKILK